MSDAFFCQIDLHDVEHSQDVEVSGILWKHHERCRRCGEERMSNLTIEEHNRRAEAQRMRRGLNPLMTTPVRTIRSL